MSTVDLLVEAIRRAEAAKVAETDVALTLLSEDGVETITLGELRVKLAHALGRAPRS